MPCRCHRFQMQIMTTLSEPRPRQIGGELFRRYGGIGCKRDELRRERTWNRLLALRTANALHKAARLRLSLVLRRKNPWIVSIRVLVVAAFFGKIDSTRVLVLAAFSEKIDESLEALTVPRRR